MPLFTDLFTITQDSKGDELVKKIWSRHTMNNQSVIRKDKALVYITKYMKLEGVIIEWRKLEIEKSSNDFTNMWNIREKGK